MTLHVVQGDAGSLAALRSIGNRSRPLHWWTMPRAAVMDDTIVIYITAPTSGFVATARVKSNDQVPDHSYPNQRLGRIADVVMLDAFVERTGAVDAISGWGWPRSPRNHTTVPDEFEEPLLELLGHPPAPRSDDTVRALEGQAREARYLSYKRSRGLRDQVVDASRGTCEGCQRDYSHVEPTRWRSLLQAHHKVPLHTLKEPVVNTPEELLVLCPTCHRLAHIGEPPTRSVQKLRSLNRKLEP